jgi:hypothetical protein
MEKSRKEIILIIILLIIFVKLISPQIVNIAEKSRATKAKMFLKSILTAEGVYYSIWTHYTDDPQLLAQECPQILEWIDNPEWSYKLESTENSFTFTLTRVSSDKNYSGKTLSIDQTGRISGSHRYR